jgi:hypothetical protein
MQGKQPPRQGSSSGGFDYSSSPIVKLTESGRTTPILKRPKISGYSTLDRKTQQEIISLRIEVERLTAQLTAITNRCEKQLTAKEARIAELEKDRKFLLDAETQLRTTSENACQVNEQQISKVTSQLNDERKKSAEVNERVIDLESERRKAMRELQTLQKELFTLNKRCETDSITFQAQIESKDVQLQLKEDMIAKLKEELDQNSKANSSRTLRDFSAPDVEVLEKLNKLEVANRKFTFENGILKESARNSGILEERLYSCERRIEQYRAMELQYNELLSKIGNTECSAPTLEVRESRGLLEKTAALVSLQEKMGQMEAQFKVLEIELREYRQRDQQQNLELQQIKGELETAITTAKHSQQQEIVLKSEIELLRGHLEAAEKVEKASQAIILKLSRKIPD